MILTGHAFFVSSRLSRSACFLKRQRAMKQSAFDRIVALWIYSIGFMSAYINMATLLHYSYAVSHCTNNFVSIFFDASKHDYSTTIIMTVICAMFICGGVAAAFINGSREFDIRHRYGEAQIVSGLVIGFSYWLLGAQGGEFIATMSFMMGFQNALIYSYRGAIFKPSHITTTFSNLGQYIGDFIMNKPESKRLVSFEVHLVVAFAAGTVTALVISKFMHGSLFLLATVAYIFLGLFYLALREAYTKNRPQDQ